MTQIERNQRRTAALFIQYVIAPTKREKKEIAEEMKFWHNQNRMAEAIAAKRKTNQPNKHAIPFF